MSACTLRRSILFIGLLMLGLAPVSEARKDQGDDQHRKSTGRASPDEIRDENVPVKQPEIRQPERRDRVIKTEPRKDANRSQPLSRQTERRDQVIQGKPHKDSNRSQPLTRQPGQLQNDHRTNQKSIVTRSQPRLSHDRYYERYSKNSGRYNIPRHETYRYHTRYVAPIRHNYYRPGYRLSILPRTYVRILIGGLPYFYFDGMFFSHHSSGYIVVRAPIGAAVHTLPPGFITFGIDGLTYYYVNDAYYIWDDYRGAYVVVNEPPRADVSIARATEGRLFVYPNHGQSEEQQAKDRYECHRWAVHETHVDPTLENGAELSNEERRSYKRAISACLEGRGYTVK